MPELPRPSLCPVTVPCWAQAAGPPGSESWAADWPPYRPHCYYLLVHPGLPLTETLVSDFYIFKSYKICLGISSTNIRSNSTNLSVSIYYFLRTFYDKLFGPSITINIRSNHYYLNQTNFITL